MLSETACRKAVRMARAHAVEVVRDGAARLQLGPVAELIKPETKGIVTASYEAAHRLGMDVNIA